MINKCPIPFEIEFWSISKTGSIIYIQKFLMALFYESKFKGRIITNSSGGRVTKIHCNSYGLFKSTWLRFGSLTLSLSTRSIPTHY